MPHSVTLITTIAAALGLALILGFVAARLKLPPLVGYLIAGIIIGPATPGFVADVDLSHQLAEIGVMLLMFGVGLHFSLDELLAVRRIALPGAIVQIAVATLLGTAVAAMWGWSLAGSIVFGLGLSVASTVVLLRALESRGMLETVNGHIAVGWLVVEDLVMVLVLVLLPPLAAWLGDSARVVGDRSLLTTLALTLSQVAVFIALMLVVGRRVFPWLLWQVAGTGSRELFTLCVVAAAVGIAYGSAALFGVSFALGAFFAGMVMRESPLSYRAAEESLPLRDAFSVLFFVSVGMLFEPQVLIRRAAPRTRGRRDHHRRQIAWPLFFSSCYFVIRSILRSPYRRAWPRSANSPSSWPGSVCPSAFCPRKVRILFSPARLSRSRSIRWCFKPSSRRRRGFARARNSLKPWNVPMIPSLRCR